MHIETLIHHFKTLKLYGMAATIIDLSQQAGPSYQTAQPILDALIKAEVAEREVRSVAYQMKLARFPAYRNLAGFEFNHSQVDEALVGGLHRCEIVESSQNMVFIGGPGTGKTQVSIAHRGWCQGCTTPSIPPALPVDD